MLAEEIKKGMLEFCMKYLVDPSTISMSKETETLLFSELISYSSVIRRIGDGAMKLETLYGMEIVENNDLPRGMFVIGGVIGKEERSKTE